VRSISAEDGECKKDLQVLDGVRSCYISNEMSPKFKTFMLWLLPVLLLIAFAWSLNLTLFNWWASGGPPVEH